MKKFTVCLLIGAMAASMLTGCGSNGGSSDSSDSKADSSSETMTIMMNGSDSDAYMEGYRKIIDGFNESNEYGVKVEIQNVTNSDYKTKLTTMMASDSETDIIFTWELGYLENFVNGNKIVSLQKYLDEDEEWKNSFNGGILEPLTYDGEVYAIPTQQSTAIMYYNRAIFDKYGLEVPTTYDEYVQVCDTLKENGVTPVALASTADDAWLVSQYIQQLSDGIKGDELFNSIKMVQENGTTKVWLKLVNCSRKKLIKDILKMDSQVFPVMRQNLCLQMDRLQCITTDVGKFPIWTRKKTLQKQKTSAAS